MYRFFLFQNLIEFKMLFFVSFYHKNRYLLQLKEFHTLL